MYPPIFSIASASSAVTALLGSNPCRLFPFGEATAKTQKPYAVWQQISGAPENYLGNAPDSDSFVAQVDVYSSTIASARQVAAALRDALEPHAHITSWRGDSRDPDTNHFRLSFDVAFIVPR